MVYDTGDLQEICLSKLAVKIHLGQSLLQADGCTFAPGGRMLGNKVQEQFVHEF